MSDRDADLIRRALGVPEFEDDEADRVMLLLARDALETMQRRIEIMRDALDEIRLHCDHAGKVARAALKKADEA